jgi:hypothetical protein
MFHHALAAFTTAYTPIWSDLPRQFPNNSTSNDTEEGESEGGLDFYIDGPLCWGIEISVNDPHINKHVSRFDNETGKYAMLTCKDYILIDFQTTKTGKPPSKREKRDKCIQVYFKPGDFSRCTCCDGNETFQVELSP